jgi:hypothetical protein
MIAVEHGFLNPELAQTLSLLPLLLSLFRCLAHDVKVPKAAQIYRKVLQAKTTIRNITRRRVALQLYVYFFSNLF